jgi:Mrp family chromosome partitioning ATPase
LFARQVTVSTPQKLAIVDVVKGIDMLHALKIPAIALVENMA